MQDISDHVQLIFPIIPTETQRYCASFYADLFEFLAFKLAYYDLVQLFHPSFCLDAMRSCDFAGRNSSPPFQSLLASFSECKNRIDQDDVIESDDDLYYNDNCKVFFSPTNYNKIRSIFWNYFTNSRRTIMVDLVEKMIIATAFGHCLLLEIRQRRVQCQFGQNQLLMSVLCLAGSYTYYFATS